MGSGYTYAYMSYPGAAYRSSMFREKDMGSLIQLIFSCDNYFRYRDLELIADSHFGHLVPVAFLRSWNIYATTSFNAKGRIGTSGIKELSKTELKDTELRELLERILM